MTAVRKRRMPADGTGGSDPKRARPRANDNFKGVGRKRSSGPWGRAKKAYDDFSRMSHTDVAKLGAKLGRKINFWANAFDMAWDVGDFAGRQIAPYIAPYIDPGGWADIPADFPEVVKEYPDRWRTYRCSQTPGGKYQRRSVTTYTPKEGTHLVNCIGGQGISANTGNNLSRGYWVANTPGFWWHVISFEKRRGTAYKSDPKPYYEFPYTKAIPRPMPDATPPLPVYRANEMPERARATGLNPRPYESVAMEYRPNAAPRLALHRHMNTPPGEKEDKRKADRGIAHALASAASGAIAGYSEARDFIDAVSRGLPKKLQREYDKLKTPQDKVKFLMDHARDIDGLAAARAVAANEVEDRLIGGLYNARRKAIAKARKKGYGPDDRGFPFGRYPNLRF